jgi:hypothetical protein
MTVYQYLADAVYAETLAQLLAPRQIAGRVNTASLCKKAIASVAQG